MMRRMQHLGVSLIVTLVLSACGNDDGGGGPPLFVDPPGIRSVDGRLDVDLRIELTNTQVGGTPVMTHLYNGLFAPPTLILNQGDTIFLNLENGLSMQDTNLHYHGTSTSAHVWIGLHLSADRSWRDVLVPGQFPFRPSAGHFYYHPHWLGNTEFQIGSGLSGFIVVAGLLDPFPELSGIVQRVMILKDTQIVDGMVPDPPDSSMPTLRSLNGLVNPTIPIQPGEVQLWRVGNIGADIYYDLELEGHIFFEIARDGNRRTQLIERDHIFLPTSSRVEFLVYGGPPGEYAFITRAIDMGPQGDMYPEVTLGKLVSQGPELTPIPPPTNFPEVPDLRGMPICCRRTMDFSESSDGSQFCINNVQFDPNITDTTVRLGCIEEWTVNNCTGENHVFHHHHLDFQIIENNGEAVPFLGRRDTVSVDFRAAAEEHPDRCQCDDDGNCFNCTCPTAEDPFGSVKLLIPYTDPVIIGRFVYHCHIGEHEDSFMMQAIEVSEDVGQCEAGTPSSTDREALTPLERAVCPF